MALIEIAKKIGSQMGKSLMKEKIKKNSQGEEEMANVIPQFQKIETKEEEMAEPLNVKKSEVESDEMHKEGMSKEDMKKAWEEKQNMLKSKKDKYVYKKVGEGAVEKVSS
jgi:hypothetical protein